MKSKLLITVTAILILAGGILVFTISTLNKTNSFNLNDYTFFIDDFEDIFVLGSIDNSKIAKEKAEKLWLEIYGESVKKEKPYKLFFDEANNVWLVTGSMSRGLFSNKKGGVANIIMQKSDGKVLAVWHDK